MNKKDKFLGRQLFILSNLGLFYIIIIAFFALPMVGALVVVFIKGMLELRYVIIATGAVVVLLLLLFLIRFLSRTAAGIRRARYAAEDEIRGAGHGKGPVEISFLGGLVSLTYGGRKSYPPALPNHDRYLELPHDGMEANAPSIDLVSQLKELNVLRETGVISEAEFHIIKDRLIHRYSGVNDE